jgi:MutL protein
MSLIAMQPSNISPAPQAMQSMLLIECGSAWTQATLFGMAEGHCRLLVRAATPSTAQTDIGRSIYETLQSIETLTGRHLLAQGQVLAPETPTGDGVDGVALEISAGGSLPLIITGPGLTALLPDVRRALATIAADPRQPESVHAAERVFPPPVSVPRVAIILGRGETSNLLPDYRAALESTARQITALVPETAPLTVVLVGTDAELQFLRAFLGQYEVVKVDLPNPQRPTALGPELTRIYEHWLHETLPGFQRAHNWVQPRAVISATTAMGRIVRFLAQRYNQHLLAANVGATSTLVVTSTAQGNLTTVQSPLLGVRQGAGALLRQAGLAAIARWLPFTLPEAALRDLILQRMLQPSFLPTTTQALAIDHALAREALRYSVHQSSLSTLSHVDVILGAGGVLAHAPHPAQAALILLDGLQPRGITNLVLDHAQIAIALGGASLLDRMAAADAVDMDALQIQLGMCVSASGVTSGQLALRAVLEYADGRRHVTDVLGGTIEVLPLGLGQRARLLLYPAPTVDIGLGPGERAQVGEPIEGGRLGVIIDARGRPLSLPAATEQRIALLRQWMGALGL